MILAFVMSYFLAIWLGRFWVGTTKWSNFVEILLLIIYTIPLFWLAILMVTYFSNPLYGFHWFSLASYDIAPSLWQKVVRVLPMVVCITIAELSYYLSLYRRNLRYESSKPYVNALVAKGLDSKNILLTHLGPNAMSPVVAALAISIPSAFSSLLLLENIFNVAGIGRLMWQAYEMSDWPVLFGTVFVISFICAIAFEIATTIQAYYQPKLDVHAQH
jgi:peptide/nickel transport system permease protein